MGWESSKDTMSEVKLKFSTKDQATNYAKKYKNIHNISISFLARAFDIYARGKSPKNLVQFS